MAQVRTLKATLRRVIAWCLVLLVGWLIIRDRRCLVVRASAAGWRLPVLFALNLGMSPNASCNDITLLHAAIGVDSNLVALLIKRGASVNQKSRGTAPLVAAAAVGSRDDVRIVLKAGANPNTRAWQGNSILLAPIHNGSTSIVQQLIAAGTDVRADSAALLIEAVRADRVDPRMIQVLLDAGADLNAADTRGATPLMWASAVASVTTVRLLLEKGADASAKDVDGRAAEDWARHEGRGDIVRLLNAKSRIGDGHVSS